MVLSLDRGGHVKVVEKSFDITVIFNLWNTSEKLASVVHN